MFDLNASNQDLTITSFAAGVESKVIKLNQVNREDSSINLIGGTSSLVEWVEVCSNIDCDRRIGYIVIPSTIAFDLILLPLKAPIKMIQSMTYKKDLNKLMNAVSTDETVTVSSNRFRRIVKLLK